MVIKCSSISMGENMLVSVIVPIYNVSLELLHRCIESVRHQAENDVEIIIIDDGSDQNNSDLYRKICNEYCDTHYYRQTNSGPSVARNVGVEKAQGEYRLFLDSDDYITDKCFEQATGIINTYRPDIVIGYTYRDLSDEGKIKHTAVDESPEKLVLDDEKEMAVLLNHMLGYEEAKYVYKNGYIGEGPCCRFFRRELFDNSLFDVIPRWSEDTLWNIELLRKCHTAVICKSRWYIYAVRKGSTVQGYRNNCYEEFMYITEKVSSVGHSIWNGNIDKGVACSVWRAIFILSRGYVFNSKNTESFGRRYQILKRAIKSTQFQNAIRLIDFHFETRRTRRIMKEILKFTMKTRLYLFTYMGIKLYVGKMS